MSPRRKRILAGSPTIAIAYLRLSPGERQTGAGDQAAGLQVQRQAIEAWAITAGVTIAAWHQDIDVSRETAPADRPGLLGALESLSTHGAGLLIAQKRDRVGAGIVTQAVIEALIRDHGARLATLDVEMGDSPEARLMASILDDISAYELAKLRLRTKAALGIKQQRGERTGSLQYGYRLAPDGHHTRHCTSDRCHGCLRLEANPTEQAIIRSMRELRDEGQSYRAIAAALGPATRTGRPWAPGTIQRILDREEH